MVLQESPLERKPSYLDLMGGTTNKLPSIVQSLATVIGGSVVGLIYQWKLALVGIACMPILISAGFIRLVNSIYSSLLAAANTLTVARCCPQGSTE